jgi:predicted metalloprotease with PDZ domain
MDHPLVELMSKEKDVGPLYGIVGFPFFARYKMALDYKAKTITFTPNGFDPPDVLKEIEATVEGLLTGGKPAPKVLAPAAQWGLVAEKAKDDEEAGVTIKKVLPGGAAAAAGLKPGDRLLTLDGRWTDSLADLYTAAGYVKAGTAVEVVVARGKKEMTFKIKPAMGL